ncbi:biopolymer transporter ExbD [Undibacterium sp.]|jgi:biopolymer transport protein ExbD|uniref:ExbD/TolR family protein n=1 Tax=Undibacterium sp. TaxID=1914977 RepID=UPI002B7E385D|nr:biopolymer transporter ExbD [Undibacterium sp.]HTD04583.1 biopolymer transporter ExbD [Undibacterium sp.]
MGFGQFNGGNDKAGKHLLPMADINVTPMVDVMLVLLVIFIITAPLLTHAIKLDLPKAHAGAAQERPETITLSFDARGQLYWNQDKIELNTLDDRLLQIARSEPQPELQLRADKSTRYEIIAQVMSAAQNHGLAKIGFVTAQPAVPPAKN